MRSYELSKSPAKVDCNSNQATRLAYAGAATIRFILQASFSMAFQISSSYHLTLPDLAKRATPINDGADGACSSPS
ncbi:hypothetical protein E3N88_03647 [Mikania micrantha]|uniref:Uncharacterized protein n=1 Tax=Mikania micrantha TaxID=192012 RepID=A0A5N6Q9G3_9ASTR|nr:hypothetical protein E3N88_03647 [Mikania micrantha]